MERPVLRLFLACSLRFARVLSAAAVLIGVLIDGPEQPLLQRLAVRDGARPARRRRVALRGTEMLRLLVVALVAANLLFFGWAQGWLAPAFAAPRHAEREPQRLAAQVRPEVVAVRPPDAARNTGTGGASCMESGALPPAEVADAEAVLAIAQVPADQWSRIATAGAEPASERVRLRVPAAAADLRSRLLALPGTALGGGFRPCGG